MQGSFDGLSGGALVGWSRRGHAGDGVTLLYGDTEVARERANLERPDLMAAGINGGGFAFPLATLERRLRELAELGLEDGCALRVVSSSGAELPGGGEAITPSNLLYLLAVATAFQQLGAVAPGASDGFD